MTEKPAVDVVTRDGSLPSGVFKAVLSVGSDLSKLGKPARDLAKWPIILKTAVELSYGPAVARSGGG